MAKPGHIYHWKHGWIPITPRAAMIKAKGSHSGASRYMKRYDIADRRTGEAERRTERKGEGPAGRGSFRYVKGTKTRDYPDRVPGGGTTAEGKDIHPDVAFRMKRTELETHAKAGSKSAQAELDRRAAKKGGTPAPKAEPKAPAPKAEPKAPAPKASGPAVGTAEHAFGKVVDTGGHRALEGRKATLHGEASGNPYDVTIHTAHRTGGVNAPTVSDKDGNYVPATWRVTFTNDKTGNTGERYLADDSPVILHEAEAPKAKPLAEHDDRELANEVFRRGGIVTTKGRYHPGLANRTAPLPARNPSLENHSDEDIAKELHRRGISVTPEGEPKPSTWTTGVNEPKAPEAPKPSVEDDHNPEGRVKAARDKYGVDSPEHKLALEEQDRYINSGLGLWPSAGPSHRVTASVRRTYGYNLETGTYERGAKVVSAHYDGNAGGVYAYRPIGTVTENPDGTFTATRHTYTPKKRQQRDHPVGYNARGEKGKVFANREEAHKALATEHTIAHTKALEKETKASEKARKVADERRAAAEAESHVAAARRAENNRTLAGLPGPGGTQWEAVDLPAPPAGSPVGVTEGLNNLGYLVKAGNAQVMINKDITPQQAKNLLANVSSAMERIQPNLPEGKSVTFNVPKDLPYFAAKPNTGAFVLAGDTTVTINPRMVTGRQWGGFEASGHAGHFMPASVKTHLDEHGNPTKQDIQEYTLVHELGHVVDGQHAHTRPGLPQGNLNHDYTNVEFHRTTTRAAGAYSKDSPAEGYAEAFAQWTLGGPGSHPVADAYAAKFGWKAPGTPSPAHAGTKAAADREVADSYQTATSTGRGLGGSNGF